MEQAISSDEIPFNFICAIGLKDDLRPGVSACVKYAKEHGHI
jgi:magnesium-transporting ATPase (P-type)